ncbi:MAG: hypothetical protein QNK05_18580 [Myxococcota bacterium]|nr:hypothetical protein [Myxococcota bacterium]
MTTPDHPTFVALLDTLVPPHLEHGLAGAGGLGLGARIAERAAGLLPVLDPVIAELERHEFAALDAAGRDRVVKELDPELAGLVGGLVFQTFVSYYEHPAVVVALGLEARPPHPEGYPLEEGDLSSLEKVRQRGPLYRTA